MILTATVVVFGLLLVGLVAWVLVRVIGDQKKNQALESQMNEMRRDLLNLSTTQAQSTTKMETIAGTGCETRARPVSRSPQTTLNTPGGRNSAISSAMSTVLTGVVSDGLSTIVLPAASAGAHFHTAIIIG